MSRRRKTGSTKHWKRKATTASAALPSPEDETWDYDPDQRQARFPRLTELLG